MESEKMVFWLTFISFFTAGNRLRAKNVEKLWTSRLEYQQHVIAMVAETYGYIQTDTQWNSMDEKSMGNC